MSATLPAKKTARPRAPKSLLRLDLGAGQRCTEGFQGVDVKAGKGIDFVADLFMPKWPFATASVQETVSNHFVEHIPHYRPEYKGIDGWWVFFNELHRVLIPGGKATFTHPYAKHDRAFWDPTHTRYIPETTWYYLDATWREAQGLDHYDAACDFEVVSLAGNGIPDDIATRAQDYQMFARTHYWNVIPDLQVELKARK